MKLKRLIPITAVSSLVATFAPISLTSCGQFKAIHLVNGYKPDTDPITEYQFKSYDEVCQYYLTLNKRVLAQDYIWSLGEYVRENMEFPEPILPFKFSKIDDALISLEDWWTEKYKNNEKKNLFCSSYSMILQLSGQTEPRKDTVNSFGSYIENSYAVISLSTVVTKLPYTIINKNVGQQNKTDARWIVKPAPDEILKDDSTWSVSSTVTITYKMKKSYDETVTTVDTLGAYWYDKNMYDAEKCEKVSYLYKLCYDALVYGSYNLMNCTLEVNK